MDQTDERVQYRNSRNQSLDSIVNELADGLALITKSASVSFNVLPAHKTRLLADEATPLWTRFTGRNQGQIQASL